MKHTIQLDDELSLLLTKWANRDDRSFNYLVSRLLRQCVVIEEERQRLLEEQQSKEQEK